MTYPAPPPIYQRRQLAQDASVATGATLAVVGGALLAVGTLLPWIRALGGLVSRNAFELGANQSITIDGPALLILGVLGAVVGIVRLAAGTDVRFFKGSALGLGIISGLWLAIEFGSLYNLADPKNVSFIGYGFWVACVGAVLLVIGGALWTKEPGWLETAIVVIALVLFVAVGALSAHAGGVESIGGSTTASSGTSLSGTQVAAIATGACTELGAASDGLSGAIDGEGTAPLAAMLAGHQFDSVKELARITGGGFDQVEAADRTFLNSLQRSVAAGALSGIRSSAQGLFVACQNSGLLPSSSTGSSGASGASGSTGGGCCSTGNTP